MLFLLYLFKNIFMVRPPVSVFYNSILYKFKQKNEFTITYYFFIYKKIKIHLTFYLIFTKHYKFINSPYIEPLVNSKKIIIDLDVEKKKYIKKVHMIFRLNDLSLNRKMKLDSIFEK